MNYFAIYLYNIHKYVIYDLYIIYIIYNLYYLYNFILENLQVHTFEKEQILHGIWIVDSAFVLGDGFEILFFL